MPSRKLLQINVTANWGSTGRIAEDIGALAMQQGWESHIAYGRKSAGGLSHAVRIGGPVGCSRAWQPARHRMFY